MSAAVGAIEFQGPIARDIDRMIGRMPALDRAIQAKYPVAQRDIGEVMKRFGQQNAPVKSGELRGAIGYRVSGNLLKFGVYGAPHAAAVNWGFKGNELVSEHKRKVTSAFGRVLEDPRTVTINTHVRKQNKPTLPYFIRAYYDSFRAMFGILNRIIEESKAEVGLDG